MQSTEMLTIRQFAAWKKIFDKDAEFASEVLKEIREIQHPRTAEEALEAILSDEFDDTPLGDLNYPEFGGRAEDAARKILEMA